MNLERLSEIIQEQNGEIPLFKRDTPESVAQMLLEEAQELVDELNEAYVTGCVWKLAGEMGDVLYLLIRLSGMTGIDLCEATELKYKRNIDKYGGQTDQQQARDEWKAKGGDEKFINDIIS